jgi:hypothetical protein
MSVALPMLVPRLAAIGVDSCWITAPAGGPLYVMAAKAAGAVGTEMHKADKSTTDGDNHPLLMVTP